MRIGLLGGSFNPPHQGHIHISLEAKKRLGLKQIWWIPAKRNPLKLVVSRKSLVVSRIEDCQEITRKYPQILVKDLEKNIASIYTIDLLKKITKQFPNYQFYWIIGADNILQFHKWKNWREIIKLVPLIVCDRDEFFYDAVKSKAFLYAKKLGRIEFLKIKKSPESSTKIRNNNLSS
ncbi:MAG: nicotinate (nicotinamide) nucleotide adenylyltransferase [Pseudomonadota bacterium]